MSKPSSISISPARSAQDFKITATLFAAYADSLEIDLAFQEFAAELKGLPGKYAPPTGEILLARAEDGTPAGCVALRPLGTEGCSEMKRLYIVPAARGLGIGRKLVSATLEVAKSLGYREVKLDTLPHMVEAISLYKRAGFVETEPYYTTPLKATIFLARDLNKP
ncbi:hypothetical protein MMC13_002873 [Lambiella insularis]|nr:hypothetical protein [Lambiella insularis]